MAAETTTIEFAWEADVYTLKSVGGKVQLIIEDQVAHPDVSAAKIGDDASLTILGSSMGKLDLSAMGDVSALAQKLKDWFPPGVVKHGHSMAEFDELKASGITVGKFSAEWCGPCKQVAPIIDRLSLEYPDVTFVHMDEAEAKDLFQREGVGCYPTFHVYVDGVKQSNKTVEGGNWKKVEDHIKALGAEKVEVGGTERPENEEVLLICEQDRFKVEKTEAGVALYVNGDMVAPPGKCPRVEIDEEKNTCTIGRNSGKLDLGDGLDVTVLAGQMKSLFPTEVKHINSTEEFNETVASGVTVAKFSAKWCGPCKAIAGAYHDMSNKLKGKVKFLHIDVDEQKELSKRHGVEAMPTFHIFKDGVKQPAMMVRGAKIQQVLMNLMQSGVDISAMMN